MTPERWVRIEALFSRALELSPDERSAFLDRASAGEPELRAQVEGLLAQHDAGPGVLDRLPAWLAPDESSAEARHPRPNGPRHQRDLDTVVIEAVRKEPEASYASALEPTGNLERQNGGHPLRTRAATLQHRALEFAKRNRVAVSAAAALFLALTALSAITLAQSLRLRQESERVARERDRALQVRSLMLEMFRTTGPGQPTGDAVTAKQLLDRQAATLDAAYDSAPEMRAEMLNVLAEGYEKLGLFDQAEPLARRALQERRALGDRHPDLVASLDLLGGLLRERGQLEEADTLLREAVAVGRAVFPEEGDARLARALNDLGNLRSTRGNFDEAATLFRESIDMHRRLFGDEHIGVATATGALADALYRGGDIAAGVTEARAALELFRKMLGPDHQRTLTAQTQLAGMQSGQGDHEGAAREYRDILERQRRVHGPSHPAVAISLTLLANDLTRLGRDAEAEQLLAEALTILRSARGASPIDITATLRAIGDIKARTGRNLEALRDYQAALNTLRRTTGERHVEAVVLLSRSATQYELLRSPVEALNSHRRAVSLADSLLGAQNSTTINVRLAFAEFLKRQGRQIELQRVLDDAERALDGASVPANSPLRERVRVLRS